MKKNIIITFFLFGTILSISAQITLPAMEVTEASYTRNSKSYQ